MQLFFKNNSFCHHHQPNIYFVYFFFAWKKQFFLMIFHITNTQFFQLNFTQWVHFTNFDGILMQKYSNMQ